MAGLNGTLLTALGSRKQQLVWFMSLMFCSDTENQQCGSGELHCCYSVIFNDEVTVRTTYRNWEHWSSSCTVFTVDAFKSKRWFLLKQQEINLIRYHEIRDSDRFHCDNSELSKLFSENTDLWNMEGLLLQIFTSVLMRNHGNREVARNKMEEKEEV